MERQRLDYEQQLQILRTSNEHEKNLSTNLDEKYFKNSYQEMYFVLQKEFNEQLEQLKMQHNIELDEEKNATKYLL